MGRNWKKAKKSKDETEVVKKAPHSFVLHRGKVGIYVLDLIRDMRRVMEPYTASKLKVLRKNVLKDFASVAGPLGVTHMIVFSRTEISLNMRLIRLPRGPTLTFRVMNYTVNRDVISSLKKHQTPCQKYFHHPLLVMNNFHTDQRHLKLTESAFQNMFPSISVNTVKLQNIQRCLLLNYESETDTIQFRHYLIKVAPTGISSSVKKLMKKKLPDMGKCADISEFFLKPAQSSDSEFDGQAGENEVDVPESMRKTISAPKVGIKLVEVGPRMTLQLIKIQEGFNDGEVLYHKFVRKTPAEREAVRKAKLAKERLRAKRRQEQAKNVEEKRLSSSTGEKRVKFKVEQTAKSENKAEPANVEKDDSSSAENLRPTIQKPSKKRRKIAS